MRLSANFQLSEFVRPGDPAPTPQQLGCLKALAIELEKARKQLGGKPITITSGLRTVDHNREVGGAKNSYHLTGQAVDLVVLGRSASQVKKALDESWKGGLGHYPDKEGRKGWTHLDIGPRRRWEG